ncbi:hypothetical protein ZWY2020_044927 [Hordeum vulgare]|nr:hypothetical protein ZWY2020_044927 [Hordeum vulgare]
MAVVLGALASYVTNMLAQMASEDIAMMIGVSSGIDELGAKLRDLKNVLADADRRTITDESVRGWVEELKRAMYQATDIIDLCQLKIMEQGPSTDTGCLHALLFCIRNPLHVHDIGTRIKNLNQKLDDICKWGGSFNFIKLEAYQDRKTTGSLATDRKTYSLMERSGAVGEKIEEDTRALVEVLTREATCDKGDHLMVVGIVGVGGIGKTTLSKKVFNDEAMEGKFAKKIWLSITRDFNDVELLSTAITAAGGDLPGVGGARDSPEVLASMALGKRGPEWDKFRHIQHVEAYADDEGIEKRWHLFYSSKPYIMETNIDMQEWSHGVAVAQAKAEAMEKERVMATARADAKAMAEAHVVPAARDEATARAKARTRKKERDVAAEGGHAMFTRFTEPNVAEKACNVPFANAEARPTPSRTTMSPPRRRPTSKDSCLR